MHSYMRPLHIVQCTWNIYHEMDVAIRRNAAEFLMKK